MGVVSIGAIVHNSNGKPMISMQKTLKFIGIVQLAKTVAILDGIIIVEIQRFIIYGLNLNSMILWTFSKVGIVSTMEFKPLLNFQLYIDEAFVLGFSFCPQISNGKIFFCPQVFFFSLVSLAT